MLNEVFKKLREQENLTQQQLALKLGTSRQNISHLESGYVEPNIDMIKKYCYFFNISADELLEIDLKKQSQTAFAVIEN